MRLLLVLLAEPNTRNLKFQGESGTGYSAKIPTVKEWIVYIHFPKQVFVGFFFLLDLLMQDFQILVKWSNIQIL